MSVFEGEQAYHEILEANHDFESIFSALWKDKLEKSFDMNVDSVQNAQVIPSKFHELCQKAIFDCIQQEFKTTYGL